MTTPVDATKRVRKAVLPVAGLGTDGLATLCASRGLIGLEVEGQRFDVGDRAGYVLAMAHYALRREDIRDEVRAGLRKLLGA